MYRHYLHISLGVKANIHAQTNEGYSIRIKTYAVRIHALNGGPVCFALALAHAKDRSVLPK